ncbi:pectinesterase protein [Spatholobus suberectus]|nr:pectinesterase protein [Spatholobus suberectus]
MNSSTLSLLLFTLSLILISHAPLPTLGKSLYESLCDEAKEYKASCLEVLKADPRIVGAKDNVELSKLILELGIKKGTDAQNYLKEVMKTNPSPAIKQCATTFYDGTVGSFKSSLGELNEDGLTANYDAKVAGDGPTTCDTALAAEKINNPSISALNKEILLISIVAFLATNNLPEDA